MHWVNIFVISFHMYYRERSIIRPSDTGLSQEFLNDNSLSHRHDPKPAEVIGRTPNGILIRSIITVSAP